MENAITQVLCAVNDYCDKNNITITFNPIGMIVITDSNGDDVLQTTAQLASHISHTNHAITATEMVDSVNYMLDDLFRMSKEYDLDITVTSDGDLNVFNGDTERQATMTVVEFKEYVQYLESHIKFLDRMK